MPQLDGLRACAALLVVWHHTVGYRLPLLGMNGLGVYGVWLFFVLSGFLITGILLAAAPEAPELVSVRKILVAFYGRRFLRIFPAYYLVIAVSAFFGIGVSFRADWLWHVAYLSNWLMAWRGHFADAAGPLWSLGVEEQFYLVWPAFILFTPRRFLPRLLVGAVVLGVASRAILAMLQFNAGASVTIIAPAPSNLDPLALGALLAWARAGGLSPDGTARYARWALRTGAFLIAFVALFSAGVITHGFRLVSVVETLGAALLSVWLVDRAATGFSVQSAAGRFLSMQTMRYLGTISYGIYLWHEPIDTFLRAHLVGNLPVVMGVVAPTWRGGWGYFIFVLSITIGVASLSWLIYERPINALKRWFRYPVHGSTSERGDFSDAEPLRA